MSEQSKTAILKSYIKSTDEECMKFCSFSSNDSSIFQSIIGRFFNEASINNEEISREIIGEVKNESMYSKIRLTIKEKIIIEALKQINKETNEIPTEKFDEILSKNYRLISCTKIDRYKDWNKNNDLLKVNFNSYYFSFLSCLINFISNNPKSPAIASNLKPLSCSITDNFSSFDPYILLRIHHIIEGLLYFNCYYNTCLGNKDKTLYLRRIREIGVKENTFINLSNCKIFEQLIENSHYALNHYDELLSKLASETKEYEFLIIKQLIISFENIANQLYYTFHNQFDERTARTKSYKYKSIILMLYVNFLSLSAQCQKIESYFPKNIQDFKKKYQLDFPLAQLFGDVYWNRVFNTRKFSRFFIRIYIDLYTKSVVKSQLNIGEHAENLDGLSEELEEELDGELGGDSSGGLSDEKMLTIMNNIIHILFSYNINLKHHICSLLDIILTNKDKIDLISKIIELKDYHYKEVYYLTNNLLLNELDKEEVNRFKFTNFFLDLEQNPNHLQNLLKELGVSNQPGISRKEKLVLNDRNYARRVNDFLCDFINGHCSKADKEKMREKALSDDLTNISEVKNIENRTKIGENLMCFNINLDEKDMKKNNDINDARDIIFNNNNLNFCINSEENKNKKNKNKNMENKSIDEIYNYIISEDKKIKKKNRKRNNKQNRKSSLNVRKNKEKKGGTDKIEGKEEHFDCDAADPDVEAFKADVLDYIKTLGKVTKIKPVINEKWLETFKV